ncbi:MAG: TraB/GumN family protein [Candidatus Woesearchaeota archaeon]
MIEIIGTSHIAKQSIDEITSHIKEKQPDIVAVELDKKRLYALKNEIETKVSFKDISRIGFQGFLFTLLGSWAQKKLGNIVGIKPGSDMLAAVKEAQNIGSKIALIDQDIEMTLRNFSRNLTWKDKWHMFLDTFSRQYRQQLKQMDLSKVPSDKLVETLLKQVKDRYPSIYKVLIEDRNHHMVSRLKRIQAGNPDAHILAIVGAGHKEGMQSLLDNQDNQKSYTFTYSL